MDGGGTAKGVSRDSRFLVWLPSGLGATAGTQKTQVSRGQQQVPSGPCKLSVQPKAANRDSEAQEGCWGWRSALISLAKSQSHQRGWAPLGSPRQDPEKPHCAQGTWRSLHKTPGEATEVGREQAAEVRFKKLGVTSCQMLWRPRKIWKGLSVFSTKRPLAPLGEHGQWRGCRGQSHV